jgi:hypothetical protein
VKIAMLPKAINMFNSIPIKIPMIFCTEMEKSIMTYVWKHKRPQIAKEIQAKSPVLEASQYLSSNCTTEP